VGTLRVATDSKWTDKSGQKQEATEWHRVIVWGRLVEIAERYLTKGRQVYIEGRLQTREWLDRAGQKRHSTEIVANSLHLVGAKSSDVPSAREPEVGETALPPEVTAETESIGLSQSWGWAHSTTACPGENESDDQ
jgi:single-strand DNA-binding protein